MTMKTRETRVSRFAWPLIAVLGGVTLGLGIFQNCSEVKFSDAPMALLQQDEIPVLSQEVVFDAGAREVPALKMFFIVDNSFTMKANQLKLAEGFQNMFSASSSASLNSFATTAYLFNTAQRVPAAGDARIAEIAARQLSIDELEAKPASEVRGYRQGDFNLGQIVGDNFGYEVVPLAGGAKTLFLPAPTLGFAEDAATGQARARIGMSKGKDEPATALAADFNERLAVFDGSKISVADANRYSDVWASESGLCTLSRILKHSDRFVQAEDVAAFVLVSDENDSDPNGQFCVHSHANLTSEPLIDVRCEAKPTTEIRYHPNACKILYYDRYLFTYTYTSRRYRTPRTNVTYQRSYLLQTRVSYWVRVPVVQDGVVRPDVFDYQQRTQTVAGDWTSSASCQERALQLGAAAERLTQSSCARADVVGRCDPQSSAVPCVAKPQTTTVDGNYYSSSEACVARAQLLPEYSSGGTCAQNGFTNYANGECPSNALPGCLAEDFIRTISDREIMISTAVDGGGLLSAGDCGVARDAVLNLVRSSIDSTAATNGTCTIRLPATKRSVFRAESTSSCADQAATFCATNPSSLRACEGVNSPGTEKGLASILALTASGEVSCSDACSKSNLSACPENVDGRALSVTPTMTVREYLRMVFNSPTIECATTVKRDTAPVILTRQLAAMSGQICPANKPLEIVTRQPYTEPGHITEAVADATSSSLTAYIQAKMQALFGERRPLMSAFIRRSTDPLGMGGTVGALYEALMLLMGGQSESIITDTYAPALARLSSLIKERLDRSFVLQVLQPHQKVRKVQRWSAATSSWTDLTPDQWSAAGQTVLIAPSLEFSSEDKFKFIYW